jgi:hypothetical protein
MSPTCSPPAWILKTEHKDKSIIAPRALCPLCFAEFLAAKLIEEEWYHQLDAKTLRCLRDHLAYGGWCEGREQ